MCREALSQGHRDARGLIDVVSRRGAWRASVLGFRV